MAWAAVSHWKREVSKPAAWVTHVPSSMTMKPPPCGGVGGGGNVGGGGELGGGGDGGGGRGGGSGASPGGYGGGEGGKGAIHTHTYPLVEPPSQGLVEARSEL